MSTTSAAASAESSARPAADAPRPTRRDVSKVARRRTLARTDGLGDLEEVGASADEARGEAGRAAGRAGVAERGEAPADARRGQAARSARGGAGAKGEADAAVGRAGRRALGVLP